MKKLIFITLCLFPVLAFAQGHKGEVQQCAPMKDGKVVYTDTVEMQNKSKEELFSAIHKWAKKNYAKDVFISSVSSNKKNGTIFVGSKVELLLNDTDKTILKYKMYITCLNGSYEIELKDISYQYDPLNQKKYKVYPAESVIANNGQSNTVDIIKDPALFCNATFFFVENLFGDVYEAADSDPDEN